MESRYLKKTGSLVERWDVRCPQVPKMSKIRSMDLLRMLRWQRWSSSLETSFLQLVCSNSSVWSRPCKSSFYSLFSILRCLQIRVPSSVNWCKLQHSTSMKSMVISTTILKWIPVSPSMKSLRPSDLNRSTSWTIWEPSQSCLSWSWS